MRKQNRQLGQKEEGGKRSSYSAKISIIQDGYDAKQDAKEDKKSKVGAIRIPISLDRDDKKETEKVQEKMQIEIDLDDKEFEKGFEAESDLGLSDLRTLQELVQNIGGIDNLQEHLDQNNHLMELVISVLESNGITCGSAPVVGDVIQQLQQSGVLHNAGVVKKYVCMIDDCQKEFSDQTSYRKHQMTHGERMFICQVEGCKKKFLDNSKLKRH